MPVQRPLRIAGHGLVQRLDDLTIGARDRSPGVVNEQALLGGGNQSRLLELGQVAAQVGLIEAQNLFQVAHAQRVIGEQVEDAKAVGVGQGFQGFVQVHERIVMHTGPGGKGRAFDRRGLLVYAGPMRIAIIGTGWVTTAHLEALSKIPEAEVVGVAGRNEARLRELTAQSGARPYSDYRALVNAEKPDAVLLLWPPHLHGDVELFLADHVGAVLVEKPLANSAEPAEAALAAFQRAGTLVAVAYQNRYREGVRRARALFAASADKPVLVNGWWVGDTPGPTWWRNKQQSGGQFVEQCTHVVDLARYLVGEVKTVQAFGTLAFQTDATVTVEDAMTVNVQFASGALGTFQTGCFSRTGGAAPGVGLTVASASAVARFSSWGFDATIDNGEGVQTLAGEPDIFERQARAFVEAVRTGDRSLIACDYADGLASLRVGLAANRSLELGGQPVSL